jgi:RNA binding exosome subunit
LDRNADDLVYKDNITFSIQFGNQLEIDEAQIDVSETMEHITACLEEFVVEEDETGHTLPGFEEGIGLDNLNIRFQDKQGI